MAVVYVPFIALLLQSSASSAGRRPDDRAETSELTVATDAHIFSLEAELSLQTREWWRWVVVRVSNYMSWIEVDDFVEREHFVRTWDVDLFDWAGDGRWNVKEWARTRGIPVAQAGGLEYEEALFCKRFNASKPNIVNDTFGLNGMAINVHGQLPGLYSGGSPYMTHAAPKWALAVQQADARAARVGDAVTQDNSIGDISMSKWDFGFGPWEEVRFRDRYTKQFDLPANFSIRRHASSVLATGLVGEALITEPLVQAYILFAYTLWREAWRAVANETRHVAVVAGKAPPAVYGNVGEAEPMSIIESPHHDTFWIESFDWEGYPAQRPSDPPAIVSTYVMKLAEAAVRGTHKPVWRCSQQCRMAATEKLYLAEAVAQGGNSWHLNGYMQDPKVPPSKSDEGTWGGSNYTAFGYTEHKWMANFTAQYRFLFTDRKRLADVAVLYSLSSVFWRRAGVLSRGVNRTHEQHLTAACRFLEDTRETYEIVALGHPALWQNDLGMSRLRQSPAEGGYQMVFVPNVDAMSDVHIQLLVKYAQAGGCVVITGAGGLDATASHDENLRKRGPDALLKLLHSSGNGTVRTLRTFDSYLTCTTSTCTAARDNLEREIRAVRATTQATDSSVQFAAPEGQQLPANLWQSTFTHGTGTMTAVHLVNYAVNGTAGTLACRTCTLRNVPLEHPIQISISRSATGLPPTAKAWLMQPGSEAQMLGVFDHGDRLATVVARLDVYGIVVFATDAEFSARASAAEARKWLERALISSRSAGLPAGTMPDGRPLMAVDRLLGTIQGDAAVKRPSADFFDSTGVALQQALPHLRSFISEVQQQVTRAANDSQAGVLNMCSVPNSCLAAFSFEQTTRLSYHPAAKLPRGFVSVVGAPVYDNSTAFGFTKPAAARLQSRVSPLQSFDTLLPDDLHRSGIMANESSTFQIDLKLQRPLPKELVLTIVSGWYDIGAPNRSAHGGFDKNDFGAWMGFASTSVSTSWGHGHLIPCMLGARGLNPGFFHTRVCRIPLLDISQTELMVGDSHPPSTVPLSLSVVFAPDGGTTGAVGDNTGWFPFAWLCNAIVLQLPNITQPYPVQRGLTISDSRAKAAVRDFHWLGPFDAEDGQGLTTVYAPESNMERSIVAAPSASATATKGLQPNGSDPIQDGQQVNGASGLAVHPWPDLDARYLGKHNQSIGWQTYSAPVGAAAPYLPLSQLLGNVRNKTVGSVAFALVQVHVTERDGSGKGNDGKRVVSLSVSMSGLGKVWLLEPASAPPSLADGISNVQALLMEDRSISGLMADELVVNITLAPGSHWLLIKSVHTFAADFVDENGDFGPPGGPIYKQSEWGLALGLA